MHQNELDGVVIGVYKANSDFKTCIDSYKIIKTTRVEDDYFLVYRGELEKAIDVGYDYDVVIPGRGHFQVTSININKVKCNNSIFSSEYNYSIHGYYVNGMQFGCSVIKVIAD